MPTVYYEVHGLTLIRCYRDVYSNYCTELTFDNQQLLNDYIKNNNIKLRKKKEKENV